MPLAQTDTPRRSTERRTSARASWIADVVREHRQLVLLVLAYVVCGQVVLAIIGRSGHLLSTVTPFLVIWTSVSAVWLVWQYLRHPKRFLMAIAPQRFAGALLAALLVPPFHATFQSLKQAIGPVRGFTWDPWLARVDATIHGQQPWAYFKSAIARPVLLQGIDLLYFSWFLVLILSIVWLTWSSRRSLRGRTLIALVLLWVVPGTLGAWAFPSAGPCYYAKLGSGSEASFEDLLRGLPSGNMARTAQTGVWEEASAGNWLPFGGISAMPSMHVALAVLLAIALWHRNRYVGLVASVYALLIQLGSVVLAWHYAVDGYVGAASACFVWWASSRLVLRDVPVPALPAVQVADEQGSYDQR